MSVENQVKLWSPQNISGASQWNSNAAFSLTTEVDGGKKTSKIKHKNSSIQLVQYNPISGSLAIPHGFKKILFTCVLSRNLSENL